MFEVLDNVVGGNLFETEMLRTAENGCGQFDRITSYNVCYTKLLRVLKTLCSAIAETFGDFESFTCNVTRSWLLTQKGIGKETADS